MRPAERSAIEVVGVDIFPEVNNTGEFVRLFPSDGLALLISSQDNGCGRELEVMEVEVIEFFLSSSVYFERPHDVDC